MVNTYIKTAVAVPPMRVADPKYNAAQIIRLMQENADCGLIVFPELCITGYTCGDLFGQSLLLDAAEQALSSIADAGMDLPGLTAVVGCPVRYENHLYNCAVFCSEGRIAAVVPKSFLPNYSEFYEARWFVSGAGIAFAEVSLAGQTVPFGTDILAEAESGAVIGAEVCEDLWVPDRPSVHACLAGANIIVNPSASDELIGKQDYRRNLVRQCSADCYSAYLYVSSGTGESSTDLVFSGHSLIAENGNLLADHIFPVHTECTTAILDLSRMEHNRKHQNTFTVFGGTGRPYRRVHIACKPLGGIDNPDVDTLHQLLQAENFPVAKNPFVPADDAERGERCRKILQIQANGLATRVRSTGIKTLVIGISGGLDSTLALIVCHEAKKLVPDIRIIAYTMPNRGNTSSLTYNNACRLMDCLQAEKREVAIENAVNDHLIAIGHGAQYKGEGDTTYENAQARMRTYILMDAANMENGLVVGTGDLSELALGWCTYNGDHMSMYGVNASVPKTLVQYICRTYADTCGDPALKDVLYSILDTPISPELTPAENGKIAQKTEEKIGKYDLNDFFLYYVLRYGLEPDRIAVLAMLAYPSLDKEEIRTALLRFFGRFFHQQFKRSCLPDGPKVGSVTLSPRGDWRMPSDASATLWLDRIRTM